MKLAFILLVPVFLFTACNSQFNKVLKSTDPEYKLKMANEYFDAKKYSLAEQLYVELFPVFKGSEKFEQLYYKYAYCSYYQKNYADAENLFKGFLGFFPNSASAEEITFMQAMSFYKQSPRPELDQANTNKAIGMMQSFINTYPNSTRVAEANAIITACREKLEEKDYKSAQLYFDLEQYKAAGITFTNLMNAYPESKHAEDYLLAAIKSYYFYAKMSVPSKQEERYEEVNKTYLDFVDRFPDSKLLDEAKEYNNLSLNNIKQLKNEQVKTSTDR